MERYLGLDVHSTSCTLAVMGPSGRRLRTIVVETHGESLIEAVKLIPGRKHLAMEEGTQSAWLVELLRPHLARCVVAAVQESRGQKSDELDAFGLADDLRSGRLGRAVYKAPLTFAKLRQLARAHRATKTDMTRSKNRLKALYRSRGIKTPGRRVYGGSHRETWLDELDAASRAAAEVLYLQLDGLTETAAHAEALLIREAKQHRAVHLLFSVPGIGWVRAADIASVVVSPHRFRTSRQFWSYCGLGIVMRTSADWVQGPEGWTRRPVTATRGLNKNCNRTLKWVFKGAAKTVLAQHRDSHLRHHYDRQLEAGIKPNLASLTLARKVASITLSVWKHEEVYDPKRHIDKHPTH